MLAGTLPAGTRVRVTQSFQAGAASVEAEVEGVVDAWESEPTGSWYAHGEGGRLWLNRLRLRKDDGELTLLVIDERSRIEQIE